MPRVATKPMSKSATQAANAVAKKSFPDTPSPGDSDYPKFQKLWMDTYAKNGGKTENKSIKSEKGAIKEARKKTKGKSKTPGSTQPCPHVNNALRSHFPRGSGQRHRSSEKPCPCKLSSIKVSCSHGRSARNGLLQIVPKDVTSGDNIKVNPKGSGDCSSKLTVYTHGFGGSGSSESKGLRSISRPTRGPVILQQYKLWKATPTVSTVEASACGGNSQLIRIERFPVGEKKFNFSFSDIISTFGSGFSDFPFDERLFTKKGAARKMRRSGEARTEDFTLAGLKKRAKARAKTTGFSASNLIPSFAIASAWKEVEKDGSNSNLAYCELAAVLEASPLLEWSTSILLYGIPIPASLKKYFAAGFYFNIKGVIKAALQLVGRKYPAPKNSFDADTVSGELGGSLTFELEATVAAFGSAGLQVSATGSTGVSLKCTAEYKFNSKIVFAGDLSWDGLKADLKAKAAWGLIDYEDQWPIMEPKKLPFEIGAIEL